MRYMCNHKRRIYSNLLIRNPRPPPCLLPFHLMILRVCQTPSDNLQRLEVRAGCFKSKVDIRWREYNYLTQWFVNTGVCLWSWLWLRRKIGLPSSSSSALDFSLHDCWTSVQSSLSKKSFSLSLSLILRGWHQNLTFTADALDSWGGKSPTGKYHCSSTKNMSHHIIYRLGLLSEGINKMQKKKKNIKTTWAH